MKKKGNAVMRLAVVVFSMIGVFVLVSVESSFADDHASDPNPSKGERTFHILKTMPLDTASYQPAAGQLVKAGIPEKFGHEEWAAVVLTNEVHQHVGIYTILGAKMGVRAREILEAPTRAVNVIAETGSRPPASCAIDGLQVALGSTLAQDLIHVSSVAQPQVAAVFEYKGRRVRLSLKQEYQKQVDDIISAAVRECGNLTSAYFERIEASSYRVWAEFDRRCIFAEADLKS